MAAAEDSSFGGPSEGRPADDSFDSPDAGRDDGTPAPSGDPDDTVADAEVVDGATPDPAAPGDDPSTPAEESASNESASNPGTSEPESAQPGTAAPARDDVDPVGVLDATAQERDEYLAALRQVQADFENYRKQTIKRQGDAIEHSTGRLVEELLPVLDACDAGIEHGDEGVTAIFTALLGVLEKAGLERLDPVGRPFDPNAHEAVMHEPAEDDDASDGPVVVEVMRPGYRWKERTLRAAMVKVRG